MNLEHLALQMWTVRKELKRDTDGTLQEVRRAGFTSIELAGTAEDTPDRFHRRCAQYGLQVIGFHQPPISSVELPELLGEIEHNAETFKCYRATTIVDPDERTNLRAYSNLAGLCGKASTHLRQHRIALFYHLYHYDYLPLPNGRGKAGFDILFDGTSASDLSFQLDTYWLHRSACTIDQFVKKCGPRCGLVHLNDCTASGEQAPLGSGVIPWRDWLPAISEKCAPEYYILEHNSPDPFRWIQESLRYWRSLPDLVGP